MPLVGANSSIGIRAHRTKRAVDSCWTSKREARSKATASRSGSSSHPSTFKAGFSEVNWVVVDFAAELSWFAESFSVLRGWSCFTKEGPTKV